MTEGRTSSVDGSQVNSLMNERRVPKGLGSSNLVELADVRLSVRGRRQTNEILRGVSLSIKRGEAFGLVGESGSGKSMTARSILGLLPAGSTVTGTVTFGEDDVSKLRPKALRALRAKRMAWIPQDPRTAIDPLHRCGHAVAEILHVNLGLSEKDARLRVPGLLAEVGIRDPDRVARAYPHELSGGLLQRVVIAMGLACDPELIVADEPTTALDVTVQAGIIRLFKRLTAERDVALLFISHDLELVAGMCSQIGVMYAGRLVEVAAAEQLFRSPRHPYTAALLQARPHTDAERLANIPGRPPSSGEVVAGCAFHPRCPFALDTCRDQTPPLSRAQRGDSLIACWRADDPQVRDAIRGKEEA